MKCPSCGFADSKVVDSRPIDEGNGIRRRRECLSCGRRFTTYEAISDNPVIVLKSDGSSEVYDRQKLFRGLLIACAKRPVSPEQIYALVDSIEFTIHNTYKTEISSKDLGNIALQKLAELDEVAYIRFASVYQDFQSAQEFSAILKEL